MAYVNPVPNQGMQQQETLQQENPNKIQEMLLANAMQPQQQPQQQQQQGGGMPGMGGGMGIASKFMGKGAGGTAATGGGEVAGGGSGGGMPAGGWWAALAAAIIANESDAKSQGRRSDDDKQYAQDLLTGKVLQQDLDQGWGKKVFGDDKYGLGGDAMFGVQASQVGDPRDAWDTLRNESSLAKLLGR